MEPSVLGKRPLEDCSRVSGLLTPPSSDSSENHESESKQPSNGKKEMARRLQWLLLLLDHANKCNRGANHQSGECSLKLCSKSKLLWNHIIGPQRCSDRECKFWNCVPTRRVLEHFTKCHDMNCPVCPPVKDFIKKKQLNRSKRQRLESPSICPSLLTTLSKEDAHFHLQELVCGPPGPSTIPDDEEFCGYCGRGEIELELPTIMCAGSHKTARKIPIDSIYFVTPDDAFYWCEGCVKRMKDEVIVMEYKTYKKKDLIMRTHEKVQEAWVQCDRCTKWVHETCAMFNSKRNNENVPFHCLLCSGEGKEVELSAPRSVTELPETRLSRFIENRVRTVITERLRSLSPTNDSRSGSVSPIRKHAVGSPVDVTRIGQMLEADNKEDMKISFSTDSSPCKAHINESCGASSSDEKETEESNFCMRDPDLHFLDSEYCPEAMNVTVRVVSDAQKSCVMRETVHHHLAQAGYPTEFPYRSKAIMAFYKTNGIDILFFVMYVQEYDAKCPQPNTNRVYISYLDSVKYFNPAFLRTAVYQEVLISYLEFVKNLGFHTAHIWACPPQGKETDYIFYRHPKDQRHPNRPRLLAWYDSLLNEAKHRGIVIDKTNMVDEYGDEPIYPFFDGDFLPGALDIVLEDMNKERDREREKTSVYRDKTRRRRGASEEECAESTIQELFLRLRKRTQEMRDEFIVIKLLPEDLVRSEEEENKLVEMQRQDKLIQTQWSDDRAQFLNFCQKNHYQFDELRRAKHSTMMIIFHFHDTREKIMQEKFNRECLRTLQHSSGCSNNPCTNEDFPCCSKLKSDISHYKMCTIRANAGCRVCKRMRCILFMHVQSCTSRVCAVPRCMEAKEHMKRTSKNSRKKITKNTSTSILIPSFSSSQTYSFGMGTLES